MKVALIFMAFALTSSPQPSENYFADVSPKTAMEIQEHILDGKFREYLDFNGDGELTIADVVGVSKRYADNCKYGNEIKLDSEVVENIIVENYTETPIYWEIDRVNGNLTRQYELTASKIMQAEIYVEFENNSDIIQVEINPFTEIITVIN